MRNKVNIKASKKLRQKSKETAAQLERAAAEEERAMKAANAAPRRKYYLGPKGGCYFINSKGNKQYVDHSYCK